MNSFIVLNRKPFYNYLILVLTLYILYVEVECRLLLVKRTYQPWWDTRTRITQRSALALLQRVRVVGYIGGRGPFRRSTTVKAVYRLFKHRVVRRFRRARKRRPLLFNKRPVRPTSVYAQHLPVYFLRKLLNYEMPFVTFNNGQKFPVIGLGTWKSKPGEVKQAVMDAIDAGYRHIDTAYVYQNEKEVGEGIKQKIKQKTVKREDLYITTKLWNTDHREDLVYPALKRSLENLQLHYVDLYLIHWPMGYKEGDELFPVDENNKTLYSETDFIDTWRAMEDLVRRKLVGSIGVSNFSSSQITEVLKIAKIKPVTNQVECHPYLNQKKLREFCKAHDIVVTAYSPLGSPDRPWAKPDELPMLERSELKELALKYDKTPAQIVLRWQIEHGNIVIPKSVTKSRIYSNIDIFNFQLRQEDIDFLDSLDCNQRLVALEWISDHKDYPFNAEF